MQNLPNRPKVNPLASLMRQPKLHVKLPSQGKFWPDGSIDMPDNGELAVFSMTAKDELLLKNPATQVGGQTLVDAIQSCIPAIKNAWQAPGFDLDTILIAIRIATYGPSMTVPVTVEGITHEYEVDLTKVLQSIDETVTWEDQLILDNGMVIFIHPLLYSAVSKASEESKETRKIMDIVNDDKLDEDKKIEMFRKSFVKLTNITLGAVADSITKIVTEDHVVVEDPIYIQEFMNQCDRELFNTIRQKINQLTENNSIKPILEKATPEMIAVGAPEFIEVPVEFTPANFFK